MKQVRIGWLVVCVGLFLVSDVQAQEWTRFRGPNGSGVFSGDEKVPVRWSPSQNTEWKAKLPGPGVSSPIIVGDRVFVTCYSGYGLDRSNPGDINKLKRHLVCVNAKTGKIVWDKPVDAVQPEDPYTGAGVPAHGYASHTPVSDGENVYVFFGKSGALAFDMDGNQLWHTKLGTESDPRRWGSAASPILFEDKVIVTASCESQALVALDKMTGKEVWRQEASGLDSLWGTPALAKTEDGTELVVNVASEVWGLNPENGKLRWYCSAGDSDQASTSAVVDEGLVIAVGGRGSGSIAVKPGGEGNVTDSNVAWTGRDSGRFASPVVYKGNVYSIANNILTRVDSKTGKQAGQVRLSGGSRGSSGGRGRGSADYASPIIANGKLYYLKGTGDMFVFEIEGDLKQVAVNRMSDESETFSGTPALSDGRMYVRSDKHLYCIVDGPFDESAEPKKEESKEAEGDAGESGDRGNRGGQRDRGGRGNRRFDPQEFFNRMDANSDGGLTKEELQGPFQERAEEWDEDKSGSVSLEEFQKGMQNMRRQGFGGRGNRGGRDGEREDNRPDRPQRPEFDKSVSDQLGIDKHRVGPHV